VALLCAGSGLAATPAVAALRVAGSDFRPRVAWLPLTQGDPAEAGADTCYLEHRRGGTLQTMITNPGSTPVTIDDVLLDGVPLEALSARPDDDPLGGCTGRGVQWWALTERSIPPGGWSVLTVNSDLLLAGTRPVLALRTSAGDTLANLPLTERPARITGLAFLPASHRTLVYLTPTAVGSRPLPITGVSVNGQPVPWSGPRRLAGDSPTLLTLSGSWPSGSQLVLRVGLGSGAAALAAPRAFPARFANAMGGFPANVTDAQLDQLVQTGFNTFVDFSDDETAHQLLPRLLTYAQAHGVGVIPTIEAAGTLNHLDDVTAYRDNPAVVAWYSWDEPDIPDPFTPVSAPAGADPLPHNYRSSAFVASDVAQIRSLDPTRPVEVNDWTLGSLNEYAPIGDVASWDHYPVEQRLPAGPPFMIRLESARAFAQAMRANASPAPFWFWPQGFAPGGRALSPDEARVYDFMALGHGAKGLQWFSYQGPSTLSIATWPEIAYETRLLSVLGPYLASGDPWPAGASTSSPNVDVSTVVSAQTAFLTIANLQYDETTDPSTFTARAGVRVRWQMPRWLAGHKLALAEVTPGGLRQLDTIHGRATITTDLTSATMFIAAPEPLIAQLKSAL